MHTQKQGKPGLGGYRFPRIISCITSFLWYGIPEYVELIKAIMMQESRGLGSDPMQCSESGYNTRYPRTPGGITEPEYSIDVGVQTIAALSY